MNSLTDPALLLHSVSLSYGEKLALDKVSFTVSPGECVILLGPNGAGKTSLFSLITRLYDTREGSIEIAGFNLKRHSSKALGRLGVVFQQPTLDMDLSVERNLLYHADLHGMGRKLARIRIHEELDRQAMFERRHEKVRQLNGGHRRRVEIARALLHKPDLLLLDEPTVGLDMPSRKAIVEYVHQLSAGQNIAVLWATHLVDEIFATDQLIVLHKGIIRFRGAVPALLEKTATPNVASAFQQLTQEGK
ncbi:MAG: ABC transporter ATP-binding protein [Proteobacteria bacterium]|nr:ABC transporter ATP-binding protein [Pseudomonadota bacterium]